MDLPRYRVRLIDRYSAEVPVSRLHWGNIHSIVHLGVPNDSNNNRLENISTNNDRRIKKECQVWMHILQVLPPSWYHW